MKNPVSKIAAVHDLSGFGRCSFSVILPTLSAMGHQVCALPTAALSTHTGGFDGFVFRDLTPDMEGWWKHWKKEGVEFSAFYSGFLGNAEQIDIVEKMIMSLPQSALVLVDPVMGDDGVMYSTYTDEMREGMKRLVKKAHVITPNVTEACFLLGKDPDQAHTYESLSSMTKDLYEMSGASVIVTGACVDSKTGCAYYEKGKDVEFYMHEKHDISYPGTGDIFASVVLGKLLRGDCLEAAAKCACDFVYSLIGYSMQFDYPTREGVLLEAKLSAIM